MAWERGLSGAPCLNGSQAGQREEFGDHSRLRSWKASTGWHGLGSEWGAGFLLENHIISPPPNS